MKCSSVRALLGWSRALINVMSYTCVFPPTTCQNAVKKVCTENE